MSITKATLVVCGLASLAASVAGSRKNDLPLCIIGQIGGGLVLLAIITYLAYQTAKEAT